MIRRLLGLLLLALVVTPIPLTETAAAEPPDCADWPMYGANPQRSFAAGCGSNIDSSSVARLVPAWVVDTPKPVTASPTVVDGVVYVGAWDGVMYALDAVSGAKRWQFQTPPAPGASFGPIVSSAAVGDVTIDGKTQRIVVFGAGPFVYALRARDGKQVWRHDASRGLPASPTEYESSPVIVDELVIIGRDTHNEGVAETGGVRGGVIALRAASGVPVWLFEPELDRRGDGCGGVWGSPTISPDNQTVFFGAANCPRDNFKWTPHTNAVTALRLKTGKPIWSFQPTGPPDRDSDFGATPNYFTDRNGRAVLGAAKKDGTYYALDPITGKQLWRRNVATPAPGIGGFIGSPAIQGGNIFGGTAIGSPPFFHSIDGATGAVRFQGGVGPTYGASAVVNDVVFNAALDDLLKVYDTNTGRLLWTAPLSGPGSSGPAIAGDMVFIGAGTSTSDACAKDSFYDAQCKALFDVALASLGGVHAFRLVNPANPLAVGGRVRAQAAHGTEVVLSGEDNRLNGYDATTGVKRTVIKSAADDKRAGLDINAEICDVPDGVPWKPDGERWIIAGEDTEQNAKAGVIKQGWGIFRLEGATLATLTATQIGKLVPDSFVTSADNPENYGCGVLPDGRVVTGDVGDQLPQDPATGQLIEWFITADHFRAVGPDRNDFVRVPHCKIDVSLGTAGGIEVDGDTVLIASNRPNVGAAQPGGIYAYDTRLWPTGETAGAGCGRTDETGQQLADADRVGRSLFAPQVPGLLTTPSDIVHSGRGTYFISSVFTGQVAEYDKSGLFRRFIVASTGQIGGITPFGLDVTRDGTLWIADIGVVGPGPSADAGSVVRVRFDADDQPLPLETIDEGLQFPDGIGVVVLPATVSRSASAQPVARPITRLPRTGSDAALPLLVAAIAALVAAGRRLSSQTVHTQG